jgi:RNA polymerase sigma-70 factor (ECF subfamily)
MELRMIPPHRVDFDELYRAHARRLVVQLFAYTQDLPLAEDLVQEAFCRALVRWSGVARYDDPVGWVRRVAWNLAASSWRRKRRHLKVARELAQETTPGPTPERIVMVRALATLPLPQRRAVIMHYLADMSVAEVARFERASETAIKQRLHRGRAALSAQLAETRPEVGNV